MLCRMPKPRWTSTSFFIYAGGLIVLGSAVGSLAYLSRSYSDAANVGWSFLVLAVLYGIAHGFRLEKNWLAAGIFAFASVVAWAVVGLFFFSLGLATDEPSSFWYHLGAGVFIGGALLHWWHTSDLDWALIAVAALVYASVARLAKRSSWAVLAAVGLVAAGAHFAVEWSSSTSSISGVASPRDWVPYAVFAFVGFLLVALGLRGRRRAQVAAPSAPPPPPP